ncbi:MAG: OmpH family outer membrane protein [Thermoanaerobaculia bacterium]
MKSTTTPRARAVILAALTGAWLGGAGSAAAQTTLQIAVIDVQRLLSESRAGKEALDRLRALGQQKQGEIEGKQTEITDLRQRLEEGRLSLSEERQVELEKGLQDRLIELRRLQDDAERELQQQRAAAFGKIEELLIPLIATVAAEKGYTLVFNKFQSGLLFATEGADITDAILERFDTVPAPAGG